MIGVLWRIFNDFAVTAIQNLIASRCLTYNTKAILATVHKQQRMALQHLSRTVSSYRYTLKIKIKIIQDVVVENH
jgi:hypothetical protein